MKHRYRTFVYSLLVLVLSISTGLTQSDTEDSGKSAQVSTGQALQRTVDILAGEIRSSVSGGQFSRVAVVPFTTLRGEENDLGLYISDKLTSELSVGIGKLQLVERSQINQALAEMRLGETGFLSEETIQKTGQALGADAVIVGSIVEIGEEVDINLRVFSVSSLEILGKASQLIEKDDVIESLLSRTTSIREGPSSQEESSRGLTKDRAGDVADGGVFYEEDFSEVEEGLIPAGWVGGSTLAVTRNLSDEGRTVLTNFKPGKHQFTIPNILFPENWRFEIECTRDHDRYDFSPFIFNIGEIKIGLFRKGIYVNDINTHHPAPPGTQVNLIAVEKSGVVVRLFVNTKKIHVIRMENLSPPTGVNFSYDRSFGIFRMMGTKLP